MVDIRVKHELSVLTEHGGSKGINSAVSFVGDTIRARGGVA